MYAFFNSNKIFFLCINVCFIYRSYQYGGPPPPPPPTNHYGQPQYIFYSFSSYQKCIFYLIGVYNRYSQPSNYPYHPQHSQQLVRQHVEYAPNQQPLPYSQPSSYQQQALPPSYQHPPQPAPPSYSLPKAPAYNLPRPQDSKSQQNGSIHLPPRAPITELPTWYKEVEQRVVLQELNQFIVEELAAAVRMNPTSNAYFKVPLKDRTKMGATPWCTLNNFTEDYQREVWWEVGLWFGLRGDDELFKGTKKSDRKCFF